MLFISPDLIKEAVTVKQVIDAIDETYEIYHSNQFQMPTRTQVSQRDNTLLLMPSMTEEAIGTKLVTLFPNNQEDPALHSVVILNCPNTGKILAVLEGSFLTGLRTGAIGGSAIRHLAKKDAASVAIIGTGTQGLYQAIAACAERPIKDIYLYNRTQAKMTTFTKVLQDWLGQDIAIHPMQTASAAVEHADIIITATSSDTPVLPENPDLLRGKLIVGIGSFQPKMREFPDCLYPLADHVLVDCDDAMEESGDIATPIAKKWLAPESIQTMAAHLASGNDISSKDATIVFKSTGMALFDLVVSQKIYQCVMDADLSQQM